MLSYPNFPGDRKPLQFPDVRMLAHISEATGADFRVVVLTRSAFNMMMSTTVCTRPLLAHPFLVLLPAEEVLCILVEARRHTTPEDAEALREAMNRQL